MNYTKLKDEITNDPLAIGYAGMTDLQVADSLNTVDRQINRVTVSGSEMINQTDATEYAALTAGKQSQWLALCGVDSIDPFGTAVDIVKTIWGNGSNTITNLAGIRKKSISRGQELSIGHVREGDVKQARA